MLRGAKCSEIEVVGPKEEEDIARLLVRVFSKWLGDSRCIALMLC
jgi:hypothetical protein